LPSCCVTWPNTQSCHSNSMSLVDISMRQQRALTMGKYAHQSIGSSFWNETETGNRTGAISDAGDDFLGINFHIRQPWDLKPAICSGMTKMTSRPPYCDVITENDNSFLPLLPVRAPATNCCSSYRQFSPDCGDIVPWYLQFPDISEFDSDLSVADVEPAELDQYLNRKSMSPNCESSETAHFPAVRSKQPSNIQIKEEVAPDPLSTILPDADLRLANGETGGDFFDIDFSNSRSGNLSHVALDVGQTNHASSAVLAPPCSNTFLETLTGSAYSNSNGAVDNAKAELYNTSSRTTPLGYLLSLDETLRASCSVSGADKEQLETFQVDIHEILTSPISDCTDYASVTDAVITSSLLV